ncbi:MAG: hypothetical protein ABI673_10310 [Novosphingobium sp.]
MDKRKDSETMTRKTKAAQADPDKTLRYVTKPGKSKARANAEVMLDPSATALATLERFNVGTFGSAGTTETYEILHEQAKAVNAGDLSQQRTMLAGQASALNSIFMEMSRRGSLNMDEYIKAADTYMRLALKAQAQCRATIEALDRLTNGHVQTVKHVHVNEGGQAVIADHFHQNSGGQENGKENEQPHATGSGPTGASPALPSPDPLGQGMPIPSRAGQAAMQDARRQ